MWFPLKQFKALMVAKIYIKYKAMALKMFCSYVPAPFYWFVEFSRAIKKISVWRSRVTSVNSHMSDSHTYEWLKSLGVTHRHTYKNTTYIPTYAYGNHNHTVSCLIIWYWTNNLF